MDMEKIKYFLLFDEFITDFSDNKNNKQRLLIDSLSTEIKDCLTNNTPLPEKVVDKYNKSVKIINIMKTIEESDDHKNKYNKLRKKAMLNGKTIQYYCKYPNDDVFIDLITNLVIGSNFINEK